MLMRGLCIGLIAGALPISVFAQRTAHGTFSASSRSSASNRSSVNGISNRVSGGDLTRFNRRGNPGIFYEGLPLWWDEPYNASTGSMQVFLLPSQPNNPEPARTVAPPQDPLLIELRGDRYVRISSGGSEPARDQKTAALTKNSAQPTTSQAANLPPTVFVYRNGHRDESSDYSIAAGVIYARSEYWTAGAWTKQIPLAELDIAESRKVNQERGVKLVLPEAPNEVVTRP